MSIRERLYPTEQDLPVLLCHTDKGNRKSQAVFKCVACGYTNNAVENIIAAGHAVTGRGGTSQALSHSDPMKRQSPKAALSVLGSLVCDGGRMSRRSTW